HGDGKPLLILGEDENGAICMAVQMSDIYDSGLFFNEIDAEEYYDLSTPYGYGGPVCRGEVSDGLKKLYVEKLYDYCRENSIVSLFFRFHPMIGNQDVLSKFQSTLKLKQTVYISTDAEEEIFKNMNTKTRNMVRKAEKNGVFVNFDSGERIDDFLGVYNETMTRIAAEKYYFFGSDELHYLIDNMKENVMVAYAKYEGEIIGSSMFLYDKNGMHYHLSGVKNDFRKLGANDLILYEAAKKACSMGLSTLHLGGGTEPEDSLFSFKKHFNQNGLKDFYIGRMIFDEEKFDKLVDIRCRTDKDFDISRPFMIKYRG
nr:GNAT family N-acetyltransferase [Lachnospiraceae bacterium]